MKERPILFSAPMVRAILDGRKTQTRRVMRIDQRDSHRTGFRRYINRADNQAWAEEFGGCYILSNLKCPYGVPGDRLWVRESGMIAVEKDAFMYADHGGKLSPDAPPDSAAWARSWKGCPSIHMPRWASRITLEVTGVRVERLQGISEEDAMAEGAPPILVPPDGGSEPHVEGFRDLWESINGSGSWDANPWVWVIEFRAAGGE